MSRMTLSEELQWRGFINQTTFKDVSAIDSDPVTFYWGVDPSAPSMTVGNLAAAMMVRHFIDHGHKAVLLVGGATGLIGDPDGKTEERTLKSMEEITKNKGGLVKQYERVFAGETFKVVDNYDWFKDIGYLQFLRDIGKHVPMRQMMAREFVQSRLSEQGAGISYAEFSYALIQGYDFLHLNRHYGVTLQLCGSDQWGNSIAGVELIRRIDGKEAHVWSTPLVINKVTGKKFGKTEEGAVWLDAELTPPTQFYQFWVNCDDGGVEEYLKVYTLIPKEELEQIVARHRENPKERYAQKRLAEEVTRIVHGEEGLRAAKAHADSLSTGKISLSMSYSIATPHEASAGSSVVDMLVETGLASSKREARQFIADGGVYINDRQTNREQFEDSDFPDGFLKLRRGKTLQNTVIIKRS